MIIAPSILSADFTRLGDEVRAVAAAGADWIHLDVMDNHYVPNLTMGPLVCEALKKLDLALPLDVHLMVNPVSKLIDRFIEVGADHITFHASTSQNVLADIHKIKAAGLQVGLALNPDEALASIKSYLPELDLVLIMSVYPGFGGQAFIEDVLEKVMELKAMNLPLKIAIDGGINAKTIARARKAGCEVFVAGSAIFHSENYAETIQKLRLGLAT